LESSRTGLKIGIVREGAIAEMILKRMTEIQAADVLNGVTAVLLKQLSYLLAERPVTKQETTDILPPFMFNDQKTFVG
jgi:hypothetical protein